MTPHEFAYFVEQQLGWYTGMCTSGLVPLVEYLKSVLTLYVDIYTHPGNSSDPWATDLRVLRRLLMGALCTDFEYGLAFGYVHSLYKAGLIKFTGNFLYGEPTALALRVLDCLQSMDTYELLDEADLGFVCPSDDDDEDDDEDEDEYGDDEPNEFDFDLTEPDA